MEYPRYRDVDEELKRKIDRRIVEVHERNPDWKSWRIADFVSNEFEVKVSESVVRRNIPEWRERQREWSRRYWERHREEVRKHKRMWREKLSPYGREILRIYVLNEELGDDAIVDAMREKCGSIASESRLKTVVRCCRAVRRGDGKTYKHVGKLSEYLGLPCPAIREELRLRHERYMGRFREVYECLVALGGVATFKELQEALGWDPRALTACLTGMRRKGLLISAGRRFVRSILPDFTARRERLTIWYLPEKRREAEERAKEIALGRLESSFRSHFRCHYKAERSRREAEKSIPLLKDAYKRRLIFTAKELISKSGCGIDAESLERALKRYVKKRSKRCLYNYGSYFSFWEEDLLCLRKVLELLRLE